MAHRGTPRSVFQKTRRLHTHVDAISSLDMTPSTITPLELRAALESKRDSLRRRVRVEQRIAGEYLRIVLRGDLVKREDLPAAIVAVFKYAPRDTPDALILDLLRPCVPGDELPDALEEARNIYSPARPPAPFSLEVFRT